MFKVILAVLLLINMTMSAPNPEPRPCTGAGCPINRCFPDPSLGWICYERKKREAEPEAQYPNYGCRVTCDRNGCSQVC